MGVTVKVIVIYDAPKHTTVTGEAAIIRVTTYVMKSKQQNKQPLKGKLPIVEWIDSIYGEE